MANYCEYLTPIEMWNGLSNMYNKKHDRFHIFDLTVKAHNMERGSDSMEEMLQQSPTHMEINRNKGTEPHGMY